MFARWKGHWGKKRQSRKWIKFFYLPIVARNLNLNYQISLCCEEIHKGRPKLVSSSRNLNFRSNLGTKNPPGKGMVWILHPQKHNENNYVDMRAREDVSPHTFH